MKKVFLFFALAAQSVPLLAGETCIPTSPPQLKRYSMSAIQEENPARPRSAANELGAPTKAMADAVAVLTDLVKPESKMATGAGRSVSSINAVAAVLNQRQAWAPNNKTTDNERQKADIEALGAAVALGTTAKTISRNYPGAAAVSSMGVDMATIAVDNAHGEDIKIERYTYGAAKSAAAVAGFAAAGGAGADKGVAIVEAAVGMGNAVSKYAIDVYFENRDNEIFKRADQELMQKNMELLRRKGMLPANAVLINSLR